MVRSPLPGDKAARPRRAAPVALALLVLAGCSFLEFAWKRIDDVIAARVDHWLDLDPRQEAALVRRLEPWLAQARRERLPRVAAFLDGLARRTDDGFDRDDAAWADARLDALYRDAARGVIDWLAPTLADLDAGQRRHLARRMEERNASYRGEYVAVDRHDRRWAMARRITGQIERWTGPLDPRQRELVHQRVRALPDTAADWYRYRLRMQAGLLALLERDADAEEIAGHLRAWWIELEPRPADDRAATDALRAGLRELLVELAAALEPSQRVAATRRLRSLADDLAELAREEPS